MTKYRISVAVLAGAGFTSVLLLLLAFKLSILSGFLSILLLPGGILASLIWRSEDFGPPLAVLAANILIYSAVSYIVISTAYRGLPVTKLRAFSIRLVTPVLILVCLACHPALNPLWPQGIVELAQEEQELREALPLGMGLYETRTVLQKKGIRFHEQVEQAPTVVLQRAARIMSAAPGDRVLFGRIDTEAGQFPCGYQIELVLLFGQDEHMT